MTVRELIVQLQQQDPNAEAWYGWKRIEIATIVESVRLSEDVGHFEVILEDEPPAEFERTVVLIR